MSQLEGGLLEKVSESHENSEDERNVRTYDLLKIFKGEFGGIATEKRSVIESKVLHHDLQNRIEFALSQLGMVIDLNLSIPSDTEDPQLIHEAIGEHSYLCTEGWSIFEDYARVSEVTKIFNNLIAFITRCSLGEIEMFKTLKEQQDELRISAKLTKSNALKRLKDQEKTLQSTIEAAVESQKIPDWLFDGIRLWIDTFMKDRLNLRIYPFEKCPSVEIICNLKRECFVDDDITHLMYGYGTKPNKKLSVFGLITSIPPKDQKSFDIFSYIREIDESNDKDKFEKVFRAIFPALDGMEAFSSFHRYPRIIVHPIAVFRNIHGLRSK